MDFNTSELNAEIKRIRAMLLNEKSFLDGKKAFLVLHSHFFSSKMTSGRSKTFEDCLFDGLIEHIARTALSLISMGL